MAAYSFIAERHAVPMYVEIENVSGVNVLEIMFKKYNINWHSIQIKNVNYIPSY